MGILTELSATGTFMPSKGSSVLMVDCVSTSKTLGAALSLSVKGGRSNSSSTVFSIDVWSRGVVLLVRNTVPASIHGEIKTHGTLIPKRSNLKPVASFIVFGVG